MPAPTEASPWGRLALAGALLLAASTVHADTVAPPAAGGKEAASPFRLAITRSEYALAAPKPAETTPAPTDRKANPRLSPLIERHAQSRGLDPALVHAVIRAESAYRVEAVSPKGAIGLMQVMPGTGRRFGVMDLAKPDDNLRAGTAYLRHLLDRYDGNLSLALAAYNAGEGAVDRHGQAIPPYPETRAYVRGILRQYQGDALPGTPARSSYLDGARLVDIDLAPYRLTAP